MVKALRKRPRADTQKNDVRRRGMAWGRTIYLFMLVGLAAALANYVWGDRIILRADGLVLQKTTEIATTSLVRVDEVLVRPGDRVTENQIVARVSSAQVLAGIAEQSARNTERARRTRRPGDNPALAGTTLTGLLSGSDGHGEEVPTRAASRDLARNALEELRQLNEDTEIRAPVSGTVGPAAPSDGSVWLPGEELMTLLSGDQYVLAFLPRRYLFEMTVGMEVRLTSGRETTTGQIAEILGISQPIPAELRTAFKPGDRHRLARISIENSQIFPTYSNVQVRDDRVLSYARRLFSASSALACERLSVQAACD